MRLGYESVNNVSGLTSKDLFTAHQLRLRTVSDVLNYFPKKESFKKRDVWFTVNSNQRHANNSLIKVDVKRTSMITCKRYRYGIFFVMFSGVLVNYPRKHVHVDLFQIGNPDKLVNDKYFRICGKWGTRNRNVTVCTISGHRIGSFEIYKPFHLLHVGMYRLTKRITQKDVRLLILHTYFGAWTKIHETIPELIQRKFHLMKSYVAIWECHFPDNFKIYRKAMRTEQITELYQYAYKLKLAYRLRYHHSGYAIKTNRRALMKLLHRLPYQLTNDQHQAAEDVMYDMRQNYRMLRLVQGDVGSGKTVVAVCAALMAVNHGYQVAVMVPTTVLGRQHTRTFKQIFSYFNAKVSFLTGHTSLVNKRKILKGLASGKVNLIVGTEALYQKNTKYHRLGLVVIDEQQQFGVKQKRLLKNKARECNVLSLTATPIPRTLTSAIYGTMDVSQIKEMPKGRKPIKTKWIKPTGSLDQQIKESILTALNRGSQTFVIAKLVHPSQRSPQLSNVFQTYHYIKHLLIKQNVLVGIMYGSMDDRVKNKVLNKFLNNQYQVLVATSVVGVGIDAPNANNIIILNADYYGLSQLHQLRGRVGRNSDQAHCLLVADPKTTNAVKRMKAIESTNDGFKIAKIDWRLRGGGNVLGLAQSGAPKFPMADLSKKADIILFQKIQRLLN